MKIKKEYTILFLVIIALSLYLFLRQDDRTQYELPQLPAVKANTITKIEIIGPEGTLSLQKKDEQWFLEPKAFPAENRTVNGMVKTLETLTLTALISESKDFLRYSLTPEKKITVKAWAGDRLLRQLDIGKAAPSVRHTFVKLVDDTNVYQARENFRSKFDQTLDDLRDKTVLTFAASDINEIRLTSADRTLTFSRQEVPLESSTQPTPVDEDKTESIKAKMVWKTADGHTANEAKLDRLLSTAADLEGETYLEDRTPTDLGSPVYILEFVGPKTHKLTIYAKLKDGGSSNPATSSKTEYVFTLADWRTNALMPVFDDLIVKADSPAGKPSQ